MQQLVALKDLSDYVKAGDHFEAPDLILVALGLAALAEHQAPRVEPRRPRGRRTTAVTP